MLEPLLKRLVLWEISGDNLMRPNPKKVGQDNVVQEPRCAHQFLAITMCWVHMRVSLYLWRTATAGSDVVQSGRPIFDDFFQHLWPYIGNNTANVVFQMVKRLWLIRVDQ
ncbi:uncharacterized protein TNCV_1369891 [Trichonephila clavipes]|nr:uncharacterized protein TNCV_1369891 [Trichonephila clavipes]